jgi:ubiquinone/menaquinone biosynthesis C-methylase UbiE
MLEQLGRKFARFATNQVLRRPGAWRFLRALIRLQFDRIAPIWDLNRSPQAFASLEAALDSLETPPRHVLDVGTGTGSAAFMAAGRFPEAQIVGVDLAGGMLAEARRKLPSGLADRVRFEEADAERLPFADASFDLVTLANMIPFFDELARVLAPGGTIVFSFSAGPQTPIYVPPERLRRELSRRGFADFATFAAGSGEALVARRQGAA